MIVMGKKLWEKDVKIWKTEPKATLFIHDGSNKYISTEASYSCQIHNYERANNGDLIWAAIWLLRPNGEKKGGPVVVRRPVIKHNGEFL